MLTPQETEGLFSAIRSMAGHGVGVIFISHKLNEVRAITDRLVVMRHGAVVAECANDDAVTARRLAHADVRPRAGGATTAGGAARPGPPFPARGEHAPRTGAPDRP